MLLLLTCNKSYSCNSVRTPAGITYSHNSNNIAHFRVFTKVGTLAWLKEYDSLFLPMKEKLESLTEDEKKNYINNTIAITTENVVIKPSAWDAMPETAKQAFSILFLGMADMLALDGKPYDRFKKPSFDLFSI